MSVYHKQGYSDGEGQRDHFSTGPIVEIFLGGPYKVLMYNN